MGCHGLCFAGVWSFRLDLVIAYSLHVLIFLFSRRGRKVLTMFGDINKPLRCLPVFSCQLHIHLLWVHAHNINAIWIKHLEVIFKVILLYEL